ncbi:MAG: hypothetical protein Q4G03_06280 [Planctomycetia bacterium]|nr:hypothetical protein [Planctomycetia bacterium]
MNPSATMIEQVVISIELGLQKNQTRILDSTNGLSEEELVAIVDYAQRLELLNGCYDHCNYFFMPLTTSQRSRLLLGRLTPNFVRPYNSNAFYFQALVFDEDVFYRCGGNPIMLVLSAIDALKFRRYLPQENPYGLRAFDAPECRSLFDLDALLRVLVYGGVYPFTSLLNSLLNNDQTFFSSDCRASHVVTSLFNFLPPHERRNCFFNVGMRFRDDPYARLIGMTRTRYSRRDAIAIGMQYAHSYRIGSASQICPTERITDPWRLYVKEILVTPERLALYCVQMSRLFLPSLGQGYLERIEALQKCPNWRETLMTFCQDSTSLTLDSARTIGGVLTDVKLERLLKEECESLPEIQIDLQNSNDSTFNECLLSAQDRQASRVATQYGGDSPCNMLTSQIQFSRHVCRVSGERSVCASAQCSTPLSLVNRVETRVRRLVDAILHGGVDSNPNDKDRNVAPRDKKPGTPSLELAPFPQLVALYPQYERQLRRLDVCVRNACRQKPRANDELRQLWSCFCQEHDAQIVEITRQRYIHFLINETQKYQNDLTDAVTYDLGVMEVFEIIST